MLKNPLTWLFYLVLGSVAISQVAGDELVAGTTLEARLSNPTGSRISHRGDPVEATIIAPVFMHGRLIIPQGAILSGFVASVQRVGLGVKHTVAHIAYCFQTLQLPDGEITPVETRLIEVETAKERVNADGTVGGIHPVANFSSSVSLYGSPFLYVAPEVALPIMGIKSLIARSPDAEIYFPTGTEIVLRLTAPAEIRASKIGEENLSSLSPEEVAKARQLIDSSPPQTQNGQHRPSDLVNLMFLGSRQQIDRAFRAAGWSGAQRESAISIYRIYHCLVERMGYRMAPMDKLMLNGKPSDTAYQKSLDTFSKRHHIRFWEQRDQARDAWLGAATEDVAYKLRDLHLTHASNPRIDNERSKVVNDLAFTGCVKAATLVTGDSTLGYRSDGPILTDGKIAVLQLNDCRNPREMASAPVNFISSSHRRCARGLLALWHDLARSNFISLGCNTARLFRAGHSSQMTANGTSLGADGRRRSVAHATAQPTWVRTSMIDTTASWPAAGPVSITLQ